VHQSFIKLYIKCVTNRSSHENLPMISSFCFSGICAAREQELILVPGLGDKKVKRLHQALHEPFRAVKQKTAGSSSGSAIDSSSSSNNNSSSSSSSNRSDVYSHSHNSSTTLSSLGKSEYISDSALTAPDLTSTATAT
jgi:hypothetical protein